MSESKKRVYPNHKGRVFVGMTPKEDKSPTGQGGGVGSKKAKVFVGMSGGVDSSLSAALLKEEGYDVTGVFIKVWHPDFLPRQNTGQACDWRKERQDAMRVAAQLDIPFKTYDFEKEYEEEVVKYMIEEYRKGNTPNPDVMCNRHIKFGSFLKKALEEGADYIATGHYSRLREVKSQKLKVKKFELLMGKDQNKDQSYFLWTLTQEDLSKSLFPIGGMEKSEVRKKAKDFNLAVAGKKDSQGICFLGKIDVKDFLKNYIKEEKGDVLDISGKVIGEHDGAYYLTLGQRHGFTITKKTPNDKPYYVVGKNMEKNTVTVSNEILKEDLKSTKKEVEIGEVNWISGRSPEGTSQMNTDGKQAKISADKKYKARLRYRQDLRDCKILKKGQDFVIVFDELQENVTPGQSLVLYDSDPSDSRGSICLGGGVIE